MTTKKKKTAYKKVPRSKLKYPSFNVLRAVANRREELEIDYLDQLTEEEKAWLNQFQEEHVLANFQNKDKLLDKSDEYRKERYRANNCRNRDTYINNKVAGKLLMLDETGLEYYMDKDETNYNHHEDTLLTLLDESRKGTELDESED
jgi:hypothetical protein